jgi:4-hydroxythreonine-4-phosphate dehydrogenase
MENESRLRIGITIGDINGIGPEIIIKTFLDNRMLQVCTPVIYGSSKTISYHRKLLNINEFNYTTIRGIRELNHKKINLINCWEEEAKINMGMPTPASGSYALKALQAACRDLQEKNIDAIVTAPVNKHSMPRDEFPFSGHTEFFASKFNAADYLMILVSESLRVAFVTGHIPISEVSKQLSKEKIVSRIKLLHQSMKRDFNIRKPRIAVLGLNPHAGDNGLIGKEEIEIISPAIREALESNILVYGPFSPDGYFGSAAYRKYDVALSMYHDQGLTGFKAISFSSGVNFTAGLPMVRTSPDHGTAYDIAGKNVASEESFRNAVYFACDVLKNRADYDEANASPLKISQLGGDR